MEENKENINNKKVDELLDSDSLDSDNSDKSVQDSKENMVSDRKDSSLDDGSKSSKQGSGNSNDMHEGVSKNVRFLIGKKVGMTQIFDENGVSFPTTVIDVEPNVITQLKTVKTDGYSAVQLGVGNVKEQNVSKAHVGKFKSNKIPLKSVLKEFRVLDHVIDSLDLGCIVTANIFDVGDFVDVTGISIGKGFAGVMKRHGFGGGRRSHGKNSVMRKPGAIGASADPARVWPGKKMAGRMGGKNVTVKKLSVLRVENNKIFVNGSIPGYDNGIVYIKS